MAALLPGASASFQVSESGGKLVAEVDGSPLPGLAARQKFLKSRVPGTADLELGKLLGMTSGELRKKINGATLITVRSQDIDAFGETGSNHLARQVMDTAVGNLARAIRKLADAGIERFVVAADHGHLFAAAKSESMRIESPGDFGKSLPLMCFMRSTSVLLPHAPSRPHPTQQRPKIARCQLVPGPPK